MRASQGLSQGSSALAPETASSARQGVRARHHEVSSLVMSECYWEQASHSERRADLPTAPSSPQSLATTSPCLIGKQPITEGDH